MIFLLEERRERREFIKLFFAESPEIVLIL
jgi:hypothetical protein